MNGIVLTLSFCLFRRFDSHSKCMGICYYCNIYVACINSATVALLSHPWLGAHCGSTWTRATLYSDIMLPMMMYRTAWSRWVLCPRVSSFYVFNILLLSLPNIAYSNCCFGSQRRWCAFHSLVLHPILNAICLAFFFLSSFCLLPIITQVLENGFLFVIGDLNDHGWRWRWDYQPVCERSRSRAASISDSSICHHSRWFIFCSFLAFLGHRSSFFVLFFVYIFLSKRVLDFSLLHSPPFSKSKTFSPFRINDFSMSFKLSLHSTSVCLDNSKAPNYAHACELAALDACTCTIDLCFLLYQHQALPGPWRRPWWSDAVGLRFYFDTGDTMPRHCESKHGANEFVRILRSQRQHHHHWPLHSLSTLLSTP